MELLTPNEPPQSAKDAVRHANAVAGTAKEDRGDGGISQDFDTFLKLLTAQMQNQDPLNPTDGTEYASQLATFSNVEQAVRTNTLLESLVAKTDQGQLGQLASWIGMEARTTEPTAYDGGPVTLTAPIPTLADTAELVVSRPDGTVVTRMVLDPDAPSHTLTPRTADGTELVPGTYRFAVNSASGDTPLDPVEAARYVPIREATMDGGATTLVLEGGVRLSADDVTGLRPGA
ncbi:flagellar hook capping FlgD N-terminal domain-containing protein [Jannaschia sp. LMIT008]|uniref:flagellar hook capping FlgD N-terminal domain-containing protein n=1 Tax=Jannaschia maritima TaxID=3032585 RepID=UPI00281261FD|nr:flagellar hook capping FlgD N-terminal domain-containing protein [Jannaschia sp. LMIT008]